MVPWLVLMHWCAGLGLGAAVGSGDLKEASLLVGGGCVLAQLIAWLRLRCPSTGAHRLVGGDGSWC